MEFFYTFFLHTLSIHYIVHYIGRQPFCSAVRILSERLHSLHSFTTFYPQCILILSVQLICVSFRRLRPPEVESSVGRIFRIRSALNLELNETVFVGRAEKEKGSITLIYQHI